MKKKKILFLLPYPHDEVGGQRFRCEHYYSLLEENGYEITIRPFYDLEMYKIMYKPGNSVYKIYKLIAGYILRLIDTFRSISYDYIYVYRELTPLGPPIFEWLITKVLRKKIIFDFDDAIWLGDENESGLKLFLKCKWKIRKIIRWSTAVSCGNEFLKEYAIQFNKNSKVIPTVVDTISRHIPYPRNKTAIPIIGWTGSHSTLIYLTDIYDILDEMSKTLAFKFRVICNHEPEVKYPWLEFKKWNKDTEIDDLIQIDIGVMPLKESKWSEGKCGFKLIQYLALEIPAVASPVGMNKYIVQEGKNGFLCDNKETWIDKLITLLKDESLRKEFGRNGRKLIEDHYSVRSASPLILDLFHSA